MTKTNKLPQGTKAMKKNNDNAFAKAGDILGAGIDALFADTDQQLSMIPLDMIEVLTQIRESFEDEENTLHDLAESIKARGVLTPILLRPHTNGYRLVAGERRFQASKLAGLEQIPAYVREMSDEEAEDAQLAENIHRKNLTQIEEARKIQRDLDRMNKKLDRQSSIEAILKKHHKSRPWLSKMLALLKLPEQATRLVTENVSADVEVINMVRTIENTDPIEAEKLVDDLKAMRGKVNARDMAASVKERVKPSKQSQESEEESRPIRVMEQLQEDKPKLDMGQSPGVATVPLAQKLSDAYADIFERGTKPRTVLFEMSPGDRKRIEAWLDTFYQDGKKAKGLGRAVILGLRAGSFCSDGDGAFALAAFLQGAAGSKFSLLDVFCSVAD